jgi:hypothetical protein
MVQSPVARPRATPRSSHDVYGSEAPGDRVAHKMHPGKEAEPFSKQPADICFASSSPPLHPHSTYRAQSRTARPAAGSSPGRSGSSASPRRGAGRVPGRCCCCYCCSCCEILLLLLLLLPRRGCARRPGTTGPGSGTREEAPAAVAVVPAGDGAGVEGRSRRVLRRDCSWSCRSSTLRVSRAKKEGQRIRAGV